jgi:Reverse transcriptase (RNA-dependent DNA polymerase)
VYGKSDCNVLPNFSYTHTININNFNVSLSEVFTKISKLKTSLSCGPDGIPSYLLQQCIYTISVPLHIIFNLSLSQGSFPNFWKYSFVRPIFKSGRREDIKNYRGICIQSSIPKILDALVTDFLSWECNRLIVDQQHGFCKSKSTATNLLQYQDVILNAFEDSHQVHSIYTDLTKAFDRVNHDLLVGKLSALGFHGSLLKWVQSFLVGRFQWVKIGNNYSNTIEVLSGVPQGSHCGPLLFNLFINDIANDIIYSQFLLFADDLKIFHVIKDYSDCLKLQCDINNLADWCKSNCMELNLSKCFAINFNRSLTNFNFTYSINSLDIESVSSIKDLGVLFDVKLTFSQHIINISLKSRKLLGYIQRNSSFLTSNTLKILYCSIVRSKLEYNSIIWNPYYGIYKDMLETVQHKFLRFVAYRLGIQAVNYTYDYSALCSNLNLTTLNNRRIQADLIFLFKLISGISHAPELLSNINFRINIMNTRSDETFHVMYHPRNYGLQRPLTRIVRSANKIDLDYFGLSLSLFKKRLKAHFLSN